MSSYIVLTVPSRLRWQFNSPTISFCDDWQLSEFLAVAVVCRFRRDLGIIWELCETHPRLCLNTAISCRNQSWICFLVNQRFVNAHVNLMFFTCKGRMRLPATVTAKRFKDDPSLESHWQISTALLPLLRSTKASRLLENAIWNTVFYPWDTCNSFWYNLCFANYHTTGVRCSGSFARMGEGASIHCCSVLCSFWWSSVW